ncbi:MAG: hypothetical protein EBZ48_14015, partial [Proteobacteria bacterium]|nr:hypothetical protein [Pseudomonadota bacterium]
GTDQGTIDLSAQSDLGTFSYSWVKAGTSLAYIDSNVSGARRLLITDGVTTTNTQRAIDGDFRFESAILNDKLLWRRYNSEGSGPGIYVDSLSGQERIFADSPNFNQAGLISFTNEVLFYKSGDTDSSAIITDGTAAGSHYILGDGTATESSLLSKFLEVGGKTLFEAKDAGGESRVYLTGGIPGDVVTAPSALSSLTQVAPLPLQSNGQSKVIFQRTVNFSSGPELFALDVASNQALSLGTTGGGSYVDLPRSMVVGGALLFTNYSYYSGQFQIWRSGGGVNNTSILKVISPPSGSSIYSYGFLGALDNSDLGPVKPFFSCDYSRRCTLWKTDGTATGTQVITTQDFQLPNQPSLEGSLAKVVTKMGGQYYFLRHTGNGYGDGFELWRSDLTAAGTVRIFDLAGMSLQSVEMLGAAPDKIFFTTAVDSYQRRLWMSDGTSSGTVELQLPSPLTLKDVSLARSSSPILFRLRTQNANTWAWRSQLWRVDGNPPLLSKIADLDQYGSDSEGDSLTINGLTYVLQSAGKLVRTDGTEQGTIELSTQNYGGWLKQFGSLLLFAVKEPDPSDDGWNHARLYVSDGTVDGTTLVTEASPDGAWRPALSTPPVVFGS